MWFHKMLNEICRRDKGKHTRLKVLITMIALGPEFHAGEEIKQKFSQMFPEDHFDFLYLRSLVYSYKLVISNAPVGKSAFSRNVTATSFTIRPEIFENLRDQLRRLDIITKDSSF